VENNNTKPPKVMGARAWMIKQEVGNYKSFDSKLMEDYAKYYHEQQSQQVSESVEGYNIMTPVEWRESRDLPALTAHEILLMEEYLKDVLQQSQSNVQNMHIGSVDWEILYAQFHNEFVNGYGGKEGITKTPHDIFNWFKSRLAGSSDGWISVENRIPICCESGNWDGLRSEKVLCSDKHGNYFICNVYHGRLDGHIFTNWYDRNDFEVEDIVKWKYID